jgi:AraC-like DNA-binding protein
MQFVFDGRSSDSSFVEAVWRTNSEGIDGSFISSAAANWEMVVTRQRGAVTLSVRGPETKASPAPIPPDAEFFGITFRMGTFLSNLPARLLLDGGIHLPEAGTRNAFWLHGSAWQFPTYENADTFVAALVHEGLLMRDPLVEAVLQNQPSDVSVRTIRRRFLQTTGLTYKDIQQIQRARQAAELLRRGVPILDTVYETGFFDQAHMTKSLRHFIGQTPAQILRPSDPELIVSP